MNKHISPPMAVVRLLRDVLLGPDRAERMRVSRLLGGAAHDMFLVRWPGEPLEGLNAVTVSTATAPLASGPSLNTKRKSSPVSPAGWARGFYGSTMTLSC